MTSKTVADIWRELFPGVRVPGGFGKMLTSELWTRTPP